MDVSEGASIQATKSYLTHIEIRYSNGTYYRISPDQVEQECSLRQVTAGEFQHISLPDQQREWYPDWLLFAKDFIIASDRCNTS